MYRFLSPMPDWERRSKPDPITGIGDKTRWTKPLFPRVPVTEGFCFYTTVAFGFEATE
jgi:hypothetical protein